MKRILSDPFRLIFSNLYLLARTTLVELKTQYAGSLFGLFWVVLGPVLLLGIYTAIYAFIFRVRPEALSVEEYILYVFSGLVPFLAFSASLTQGAMSLAANRQILLSTVFPPDLLPLRAVLIASIILPVGLFMVVIGDTIFGHFTWHSLLIIPLLILQTMFLSGVAWVLSLLTIVMRDIQQILQYVTIMLLVVTPIAYTPDMIPNKLKMVMYLNPLSYYTTSFQYVLSYDALPPTEIWIGALVLALSSFYCGYWLFQKIKMSFYDYV